MNKFNLNYTPEFHIWLRMLIHIATSWIVFHLAKDLFLMVENLIHP